MMMLRDVGGLHGLGGFGGLADSQNGPGGITCDSGTVWNDFYSSCVSACPAGGSYDANGVCQGQAAGPSGGSSCPMGTVWVNFYQSCVSACPGGMVYNTSGICSSPSGGGSSTGSSATTAANSSGGSTSTSIVGLLAAVGAKLVGAPSYVPGAITVAPPTPWYSTPIGLLLIVGGIAGVYFMTKSPTPAAAPKAA